MKKLFVMAAGLVLLTSTASAELQTQVIRHFDGGTTINQWDPDDGYSYSEHFAPGREVIIPTQKIIMTPEEMDALRDSNVSDAVNAWKAQNVIINVDTDNDDNKKK